MIIKTYTRDFLFIGLCNANDVQIKEQPNKEDSYSFSITDNSIMTNAYFCELIDQETNELKKMPNKVGVITSIDKDYKVSVASMERYLEKISNIPENWNWNLKNLSNVIKDHCYGFRQITYSSLSEIQSFVSSYHIQTAVVESGNGEVFADSAPFFSSENERYYYSDGYVIYRIQVPTNARRQGMVLRWKDTVGTTTDIGVQFAWSDSTTIPTTWSNEQSPVRGDSYTPNETDGIDIPESLLSYLYVKFNLKYDTGTISASYPKGVNYENEITTVTEPENNIVYYGKTAILYGFEVIYRVDTLISYGEIDVPNTKILDADITGKGNLLESLKALCEAYGYTFTITKTGNNFYLNVYKDYGTDLTNETFVSAKVNSLITRQDYKKELLEAVDAYGSGDGIDRIHTFVKIVDNPMNIGTFEDNDESDINTLVTKATNYINKENDELIAISFEFYERQFNISDKIRILCNDVVFTGKITEVSLNLKNSGWTKTYTVGIKSSALRTLFDPMFDGNYIPTVLAPRNVTANRVADGWVITWSSNYTNFILEYRKDENSFWQRKFINGNSVTIPYTEYLKIYEFRVYAINDNIISSASNTIIFDSGKDTSVDRIMDELEEVKHQSKVVVLELSSSSVTRNRLTILEPNPIVANAKTINGAFNGLFVLEATYNHLHWQTIAESSEPENSRELNLPVTITVDDEQHFAVGFRVSVREAIETIIDDETAYSTGDLFAQKDIAVVLNADARPIYWGARDTYPVGNLQVGDFYFDTNTQELDGGVLRVWTGSAWVLFNPTDSTYANAFNIAVTDIMVWVREHGVENFVAINAIFESIGASRAFITVLEAHELKLTGTFSGGGSTVDNAIISIKESSGVVNSSFHGTGKNDLSVVEESAEKGFVEVKILDAEEGDATDFGGVIFKDNGINKEVHSDRLQEQDWNTAKSWAEETRSGKAWRLPTRAELSLINPAGAWWTGETSGDEVYIWEGGSSELVGKQGLVDIASFFNASRRRRISQLVGTKIYIPEHNGTALEIIDTTNNTVTTIANFFNISGYRYASHLVGTKIYTPQSYGTALDIIDTTNNTVTTIANFFNANRYRYTSHLVGTKIYTPQHNGTALEIIDTTNNTVTTIANFFNAIRERRTSQLVGTKIYTPQSYGTALDIIDTTNNTVTTIANFFNANRYRYTSHLVGTKIYTPQHNGTALEIIDTTNNTVTTIANFFNAIRERRTSQLVGTKIYIPEYNGTALEIIDTTNNTVTTIANFFNASRERYTSQLVGTKIYIPEYIGTGLEIIHTANTLPVRNNTETQRRQVSSSSDGTTWTIRSTDLITAGQTFTSYFGLKLRFAGDTHKVGDYWRYEQDEMGAFSLQDSSGEEYVRAMNGQLHVKTLVGELAKPKFTGKIKTEKAMNKVIFYDENDDVVNPVNAIAGIEIGDVVWIKYAGYDKLHTVELLEAGYMIVNYEHCDTRGKGSLMLEDKTNVSATVELLTKWYNAPLGLGQAWVDVTAFRPQNTTTHTNTTKRAFQIDVPSKVGAIIVGTQHLSQGVGTQNVDYSLSSHNIIVPVDASYRQSSALLERRHFKELR